MGVHTWYFVNDTMNLSGKYNEVQVENLPDRMPFTLADVNERSPWNE